MGDITYLPLAGGEFLCLATVLACFSRKVVCWSIADHTRTDLVTDALKLAAATRGVLDGRCSTPFTEPRPRRTATGRRRDPGPGSRRLVGHGQRDGAQQGVYLAPVLGGPGCRPDARCPQRGREPRHGRLNLAAVEVPVERESPGRRRMPTTSNQPSAREPA
ncbi:DDE-type integrase/transposase/recombinase [Streptomyces sp. NPDC051909]|uniref:DDE-type integrase/transposase/recombinase n=1 Tax=Streptomyces sp. NPDC051909 TaxID=3154944 RepID=UPI003424367F